MDILNYNKVKEWIKTGRKKVGLALGGGAARGIAHVGVLKQLSHYNIPIDFIAGTSAGAIAGAFYAAGMDMDELVKIANKLTWKNFARFKLSRKSMVSSKPVQELLEKHLGQIKFKDLKMPFWVLGTDILTGEGVYLNDPELSVALAARASSSFPGIYEPTDVNGRYIFDGGAAFNLPCPVVREMGADIVIGVDVIPKIKLKTLPHNIGTLVDRGLDILLNGVSKYVYPQGDLILTPVKERVTSFNVKRGDKLVQMGIKAVDENIDQIKALLQ